MSGRRTVGVVASFLAAVLLLPLAAALGPSAVRAAAPDLAIVSDARYDVRPDEGRVRISLDIEATNRRTDSVTRRYYFEEGYLAVLPGTSGFAATAEGESPSVAVRTRTDDYTLLTIGFGRRLYSGESMRLRVTFELPDPGGAADRDVRVTPSLVAFPVWAFATDGTPGSTASVVFPAGYTSQVAVGELPPPVETADGRTVYRTGPLAAPLDFYAYLTADRPAAFASSSFTTRVGEAAVDVTLRAWQDDPDWAARTGDLYRRGLPALGAAIGLAFPGEPRLTVEESHSRTIGGYAGLFDPNAATMRVAYSAPPIVVLHEAAHAWFNGRLLADRWANEAFASYYADVAAEALGLEAVRAPGLTEALEAARIPLNAWGDVGREEAAVEDYAYAAGLELARAIADRAGADGLREVWRAATAAENPYRPIQAAEPERAPGDRPDWRGLLDLLEERTQASYADLWRAFVVRPDEEELLDARELARFAYLQAVEAAGDWELSQSIRVALAAWRFDDARTLIARALDVLGERPTLEAEARAAGLVLPDRLREVFESETGPDAAGPELDAERGAVREVVIAAAAGVAPRDVLAEIGLLGEDPATDLAAAREAFEIGELGRATDEARAAAAAWTEAPSVGRGRVIAVLALVAALALLVFVVARLWRGARAGRRAQARFVGGNGRYATLAGGSSAVAHAPAAGATPDAQAEAEDRAAPGAGGPGARTGDPAGDDAGDPTDDPQTGDPT